MAKSQALEGLATVNIVGYRLVPPTDLLANPQNARRHPNTQRDAMRASLRALGWIAPVLQSVRSGALIDGHLRIEEAISAGVPVVPVVDVDLTPEQEALALAAYDPIAAMASYDREALDSLLRDVSTDETALQALLADVAQSAGLEYGATDAIADVPAQIDRAAELQAIWGTERGQLWTIPSATVPGQAHRLLCGDSTDAADVTRLMDGRQADCVFTSPPYAVGVDYGVYQDTIGNLRAMLPLLSRRWLDVVVPGGFAVVNFGDIAPASDIAEVNEPCEYPMAVEYWPVFRADGWLLWSRRIWCKPNARVNSLWCIGSNRAATDWEHLWTWRKPGTPILQRVDGEYRSASGWYQSSQMHGVDIGKETHGAGMAVGIALWMLLVHSRPEAVVHEPFLGTGTTVVAAESLRRIAYAAEIEPKFLAVALQRLADLGLAPERA